MRYTTSFLAVVGTLACAAGTAQAQSNVTLSGTLDVGVYRGYDDATHLGGISRSNIALSGSEDLGRGLAAIFKLSSRFKLNNGQFEDPKTMWSGESTVGLKGAFGTVRFGRALTAVWQNDWSFDPWYNYDSIASPAWWLWHGNSPADPNVSSTGASFSRLNNGIFYTSPTVGGLSVDVSGGVERQTADKNHSLSMALKYGNGPVSLMAATEHTPDNNRFNFFAGKYSFGSLAVMGAYDHEVLPTGARNRSYTLGGQYVVGAMTFNLGYGRQLDYRANFFGGSAIYALSKRTNLYVSLGNQGRNFWGAADSKTAVGVGMNHSF